MLKRMKVLCCGILLLSLHLVFAPMLLASVTWQQTGGPTGGSIHVLTIDPTNSQTIYAGTEFGGLYKSTNGGSSWTAVNSGLTNLIIYSIAVDPTNSQTIYAGTQFGGVFKSTNGGSSWTAVNSGLTSSTILGLDINPSNTQTLYAGTGNGVFMSTNGGGTWNAVNSGLTSTNVQTLSTDPTNPQTLYAGTGSGGIFKSTNGGASWTTVNVGLTDTNVISLAIAPNNPQTLYAGTGSGGLFKSINGGTSWNAANDGDNNLSAVALAIDPTNSQNIYAGTNGKVYNSSNGGTSWNIVNNGLTSSESVYQVQALAIDPTNPQTIYVGFQNGGVYKSTNGGTSWITANSGLTSSIVYALAIDPSNSQTLYAATITGLFKSINSGSSWSQINNGLNFIWAVAVAIDPQSPQTIYAGIVGGGGVFKSTNGGTSWSLVLDITNVDALAIDSTNTQTLYAGTGDGVYKSTDGGGSWTAANSGLTTSTVVALAIDPSNTQTLYAGTDGGGIFKSTNGGASWSTVNNGLGTSYIYALAIDSTNTQTLYAGAYGGVFKSTNGGTSWSQINSSTYVNTLAIAPTNPQTIYAGTSVGVLASTNGGTSWSALNSGLTITNVNSLTIDPNNPTTLYAGTFASGVFELGTLTPSITSWPTASGITLGQALSSSTLTGGSASVPGTFAFTNPATVPGSAGNYSASVTFTPTDSTDYNSVTGTVTVAVGKATPTITTLPTATGITYGQALSASTLTGGAGSVPGSFTFTSPSTVPGTAGSFSASVTFTPTDSADYNSVTGSVTVAVAKATPTITTLPTASSITLDQALSASTLSGGAGSVPGSFAFTNPSTVPASNGSYSASITFTPTASTNYNSVTGTVTVTVASSGGSVGTVSLAQTGQTMCYDSSGNVISCTGTGQDGELQKGVAWPTPRFTANGDGTQTDNLTKLIWPNDASTPTYGVCVGGIQTWQNALDYVTCLNVNNYLGHNDWRLPNVNEIDSLMNDGQSNLASWLNGQGFSNVIVSLKYYWSSTTCPGNTDFTIVAFMGYDYEPNGLKSLSQYVWPVRGGQSTSVIWRTGQQTSFYAGDDGALQFGISWPTPRFSNNGDQTVTDNLTSLMWTQDANAPGPSTCNPGAYMTWQGALNYAACLNINNYLGHNDWRLPNKRELSSLLDHSQSGPSLPIGNPFINAKSDYYWSSTTSPNYKYNAYAYLFDYGGEAYVGKTNTYAVWPVRTVAVGKTTPTITTLPTATGITYGQALSASTLTGGAGTVSGSFAFTTPSTTPGAGNYNASVTFTPTDSTDYNSVTGTVTVAVGKATPTIITLPTATGITYGQALSTSTLSGGAGSIPGSFAFTTPSTTPGAGSYSASVTFTPTSSANYNSVTGTVTVAVGKATPTITTLPTASGITYGQALSASTLTGGAGTVPGSFAFTTPSTVPSSAGTYSASITFTPSDATDYTTVSGSVNVAVASITANGACGTSNGVMFLFTPSVNLCTSGNPTSVSGNGPWNWSCTGTGGGTTAFCSAAKAAAPTTPVATTTVPVVNFAGAKTGTTFTVYRSAGGSTPVQIASGTSTTITDSTVLLPNTIYTYLVSSDTDSTQTTVMTIHTPLYNGWNIIAVPYQTTGVAPATFFGSPVSAIYQWIPSGATPESSDSVLGSYTTVSSLVPGNGYFVKASNNGTLLTYSGTPGPASATVTLKPGWTMIANTSTTNKTNIGSTWLIDGSPLSNAIVGLTPKIAGSIYYWNGVTYDSWSVETANPQIEPWKGYWMLNLDSVNHVLTIQ